MSLTLRGILRLYRLLPRLSRQVATVSTEALISIYKIKKQPLYISRDGRKEMIGSGLDILSVEYTQGIYVEMPTRQEGERSCSLGWMDK